jgi:hypothetical protein
VAGFNYHQWDQEPSGIVEPQGLWALGSATLPERGSLRMRRHPGVGRDMGWLLPMGPIPKPKPYQAAIIVA